MTEDRGTVLDLVDRNAAEHPEVTAVIDGGTRLTWAQYRTRARAVALALLDLGVVPGEVIGLHQVNRAEHVLSDVGALFAGATPTSFYNTLAPDQLRYVAGDSAATVVILDADKLPLWLSIRDQLPGLRALVVLDLGPDEEVPPGVYRFAELVDAAAAHLTQRLGEIEAAAAKVQPDGALTIVYTSGTTGAPKGTIITHAGARWVMDGVLARLRESGRDVPPAGWTAVSYLPLAHLAERMFTHYLAIGHALTVTYVRDPKQLIGVLPAARPHVFLGVPRIWEKIHSTIRERAVTEKQPVRRALIRLAVGVARSAGAARFGGGSPDLATRLLHPVLDVLVYRRIRATLGLDRVELAVSGAAPISAEVLEFFAGLGITITEAYGMTETSAALTVSPLDRPRQGTVGTALPGVELRIAEDGEILARGPNITPGYLNRPEATAEAIDADGWLHTGDLGELDADGYLRITGRKKELIINAAGKNISPANIELALSGESDLLGPVFVFGDAKPYLVALVTLDPMGWPDWWPRRSRPRGSAP
ncbi:MAG: hypothetical protein QOF38_1261, partial [Pseudonocardiales bacterium]|nr:hypothetical protein [Pseudonocardiales bacterium]